MSRLPKAKMPENMMLCELRIITSTSRVDDALLNGRKI
jgi:hypothetical protein